MGREIGKEHGLARLCFVLGVAVALAALVLPPTAAVAIGFLGSVLASLQGLAVVGDSANREGDLEIGTVSPAQECSCIERWAGRLATMPSGLAQYLAQSAKAKPPRGQATRLRALPVILAMSSLLVFGVIGGVIAADDIADDSGEEPPAAEAEGGTSPTPQAESGIEEGNDGEDPPTYAESCPAMPDPLDIGHGLGKLFRRDGAFKAGCGSSERQVPGTGAWIAAGICDEQLRSVAVASRDGSKALLYGAAARFAWRAGLRKELIGAESAEPAGGEVYSVAILEGTYGFARTASAAGRSEREVRDCSEVTGTARPFAELPPQMLLHWRNLIERRAAWSWPHREDVAGDSLFFASYPSGVVTAHGACVTDDSCYLDVDGVRWPGEGTAYVSLAELAPYMPPPAR